MCLWSNTVQQVFEESIAELVKDEQPFDVLTLRNIMRRRVPNENILYNEVFSELWHYYRKGNFKVPYFIRLKEVAPLDGAPEPVVTVEYVPAARFTEKV